MLALGRYSSADEVDADLNIYALRLTAYRVINKSDTHYGFARLDAFGRIYNQVLEYVANVQDVETILGELIAEGRISEADIDKGGDKSIKAVLKKLDAKSVLNGADRDLLMETLITNLNIKQVLYFRTRCSTRPTRRSAIRSSGTSRSTIRAVERHRFERGARSIGRNTGEVIGVFGTMNWSRPTIGRWPACFSGQGIGNNNPIDFNSSVDVHNLVADRGQAEEPAFAVWPQDILPKLDPAKVGRGGVVFAKYCAACHAEINRISDERRVVAHMTSQTNLGTDSQMAVNSAAYAGYSGILRNTYVTVDRARSCSISNPRSRPF